MLLVLLPAIPVGGKYISNCYSSGHNSSDPPTNLKNEADKSSPQGLGGPTHAALAFSGWPGYCLLPPRTRTHIHTQKHICKAARKRKYIHCIHAAAESESRVVLHHKLPFFATRAMLSARGLEPRTLDSQLISSWGGHCWPPPPPARPRIAPFFHCFIRAAATRGEGYIIADAHTCRRAVFTFFASTWVARVLFFFVTKLLMVVQRNELHVVGLVFFCWYAWGGMNV